MLDAFTFWSALVVGVVSLVDFLMYPGERQRLSDRVAGWWVRVEDMSFSGFVSADAARLRAAFQRLVGTRPWHPRFIFSSIVAIGALQAVILFLAPPLTGNPRDVAQSSCFVWLVISSAFSGWLSMTTTDLFLIVMSKSTNVIALVALMLLDAAISCVLFLATLWTAVTLNFMATYWMSNGRLTAEFSWSFLKYYIDVVDSYGPGAGVAIRVSAIICVLPSLAHIGAVILFMVSRAFQPVLKPIVSRILFAFHDTKRGLLCALAAVLAALAKLIQLWAKAHGA